MPTNPKISLGARLERKAMRAHLRRLLSHDPRNFSLQKALKFVLTRQERYDSKPGGL